MGFNSVARIWRLAIFTHIQNSFSSGELSPSIFGRTDLAKWHSGASTMRNFFVNYRGGAASRAGTAFVGQCKQGSPVGGATVNNVSGGTPINSGPPRDIPLQFNIEQGYALEFGDYYMRVKSDGQYITETPKNIVSISQANPGVIDITAHGYSNGDWVYGSGIGGMTQFNGLTWIVQNVTTNTFTLTDLYGNPVNTNLFPAYTSGGSFARIYTVTTVYQAVDLAYLKWTQSADTMSLTCVNTQTLTEYATYDLERNGATDWTFTEVTFASSIAAPTGAAATATSSSTTVDTYYSYVVTAVAEDGEESVASNAAAVENNNISIYAGSNTINWNSVTNASSYNVYGATSSYDTPVPAGVLYGLLGTSYGTSFTDTNIEADFTQVPPTHQNPFARGTILNVNYGAGGSGYTQAGVTYTINTSTGSGAILLPVVTNGVVVAWIVVNGGVGYALTDTITVTGDGTGATATLNVGPESGTYPSTVAYFQQRRVYGSTLNNPDTYYMSQPGAFLNMDSSIPASDTDAIIGQPWSQQINGIQYMVPMPGGLVILTGSGAWQLTGSSSNATVTPANQDATPQAYNGCHNHIGPIVVNYDILYVQAKGSIVRDLSYNFFVNIYTGTDTTVLSNQLFTNHQIQQWAYAEEPYKIIWAVRDDGILLSFTYLKEQDVYGWARSDTNGLFQSVCSVTEPPVDAIYTIVQRYVNGMWLYYSERMDNRTWANVEQAWCVDAGLSLPMTFPQATLSPAAANGTSNITSVLLPTGGKNYTAPIITAVDNSGDGYGATFGYTLSGGVITSIFPILNGEYYTPGETEINIEDATGAGAQAYPVITNIVAFNASSSVFTSGMVGDVIRVGGGIATITSYVSGTQVLANITQPITNTVPNDPNNTPIPATQNSSYAGLQLPDSTWSISTPVTQISGLNHLDGLQVTGLMDGGVIPPTTVVNGSITLPAPASAIVVGLPFLPQLQGMYSDMPAQTTVQGKRKNIFGVTVRMEASRGMQVGVNQADSSTQPNGATVPWTGLYEFKERSALVNAGSSIPLFTGDEYIIPSGTWDEKGQIAIQQPYPLPANVLAFVSWSAIGDTDG